jgi:hypothetical protein
MTWAVGDAVLWAIVAGIVISETRKWLRGRRLDREAREQRDRRDAGPLTDGREAAEFFNSLRELDGRRL